MTTKKSFDEIWQDLGRQVLEMVYAQADGVMLLTDEGYKENKLGRGLSLSYNIVTKAHGNTRTVEGVAGQGNDV
ncbi:MAG: hypothetical protein LH606_20205 [Cytophagaceae bacterium]|nr:hypothetical protein [Cytophagaceae bacterium]